MFLKEKAKKDETQDDSIILDILESIPKPLEDFHDDKAEEKDEVEYFLIEKGSKNGNDMITDT